MAKGIELGDMKLLRTLPIDWSEVARETGMTKGTLCKNALFGWGVHGTYVDDPDFATVTPPEMEDGETLLRVEANDWCFYGELPK